MVIGISLGEELPTNELIKKTLDELYKDNNVPTDGGLHS